MRNCYRNKSIWCYVTHPTLVPVINPNLNLNHSPPPPEKFIILPNFDKHLDTMRLKKKRQKYIQQFLDETDYLSQKSGLHIILLYLRTNCEVWLVENQSRAVQQIRMYHG